VKIDFFELVDLFDFSDCSDLWPMVSVLEESGVDFVPFDVM
jgi:hypothetical protein